MLNQEHLFVFLSEIKHASAPKKKRIEQINVQVSLPTQGLSTLGLDKVMRLYKNV